MRDGAAPRVLVQGVGDIDSAVAVALFRAGYGVALVDGRQPATTRCMMAFADAVFDGQAPPWMASPSSAWTTSVDW